MIISTKACRLAAYEEGVGNLRELVIQDGMLIARLGKVNIALPMSLEQSLQPLIGRRIAILRTDLPQKEYLFHVLGEEPKHEENDWKGR